MIKYLVMVFGNDKVFVNFVNDLKHDSDQIVYIDSWCALILVKKTLISTQQTQFSVEFCFAKFEKWGRTDVQTTCAKTMIPTGRDCGLAEWINSKK